MSDRNNTGPRPSGYRNAAPSLRSWLLAVPLTAIAACSASYPAAPEPVLASLEVHYPGPTGWTFPGFSQTFKAYAVNTDGGYEDVTVRATWTSSDVTVVEHTGTNIGSNGRASYRNTQFNVSTQVVAADKQVAIVASLGGGSVSAVLAVWTALPMFFSWTSDVGESIGQGGYGRFTPPSTTFNASCDGSDIHIFATGSNWASLAFGAPRGTPLRVGSYEGAIHLQARNATDPNATDPGINVSVGSRACGTPLFGRFVVHEAEFTAQGDVMRFWATFEQRCNQPKIGRAHV